MGLGIRNVCNEGQHIPPKSLNGRTAEKIVIKKAPSDIMGLVIRIKQSIEIIAVRLTFTIFLQHIDIRYNNQLISFRDSKF